MDKVKQNARLRYSFATFLAANGLRCTPERDHVLKIALGFRGRFGASELVEACRTSDSMRVSRATVFNSLPLMEKAGIMRRVVVDREISYEVIRQGMQLKARQNLVCTECGRIRRLQAPLLAAWVENQGYRDFFPQPDSALLTVHGLCGKCRRKTRIK